MRKFTLKEDGCTPFILTKEEYDTCVKVIKDTRAKELEKAFQNFCEVHGTDATIAFLEKHFKKVKENI